MENTRFQFSLRSLIIIVLICGVLLGGVVWFYYYSKQMSAEYNTATVISATARYVREKKAWPPNWESLQIIPNIRDQVVMRFDVTLKDLRGHPEKVNALIQPIHGAFRFQGIDDQAQKELKWSNQEATKE